MKAWQEHDDTIYILENGKYYTLTATAEDVCKEIHGSYYLEDGYLSTEDYIMYADANREHWQPEENEAERFDKRTAERIAQGKPLEIVINKDKGEK